MSDPREEKLPKWAREEMALLRLRLAEVEADFRDAEAMPGPDSRVIISPLSARPRVCGAFDSVAFNVSGEPSTSTTDRGWVTVRLRDGGLEIYTTDRLCLLPQASNVAMAFPERVLRGAP